MIRRAQVHDPHSSPLETLYGILHHMRARFIFRQKLIYPDEAIREMVLWQLPKSTKDRPHCLKYRLYYGLADGTRVVRYDNEMGKGDHRHYGEQEEPYSFTDVETLVADFLADIARVRRGEA